MLKKNYVELWSERVNLDNGNSYSYSEVIDILNNLFIKAEDKGLKDKRFFFEVDEDEYINIAVSGVRYEN
jgi:ribosomal protein L20